MLPTILAVVLTVAFAATGAYAFTRYVRLSTPGRAASGTARAVELLHLLMSIAMIAMAWGWSGGPATGSGIVQLAVFGLFTVLFVVLATRTRTLTAVISCSAHALMGGAMVWMVAAMPVLMGHAAGDDADAGEHAGHAGHGGAMGGMDMGATAAAPAPTWVLVVNGLLAALLVAAAIYWAVRAARAVTPATAPAGSIDRGGAGPAGEEPRGSGPVATLAPAAELAPLVIGGRARVLAASCHTVMSLGMAAMLLAMV